VERCGSAGPPIIDEFGTMFASRIKGFTVGIRHSLCFGGSLVWCSHGSDGVLHGPCKG